MTGPGGERVAIEAGVEEAAAAQESGACLLDIREPHERLTGAPEGAVPVGPGVLAALPDLGVETDHAFYLICAQGERSLRLAGELRQAGYPGAISVRGGFRNWTARGLPSRLPEGLERGQVERYARHLVMPRVGPGGQQALLQASILLVGAGGLGSPAALYLAAAGVGRIGIVDHDRVERSNLQRQVLHDDASVGCPKVESAAARLSALNPDVEIVGIESRLCPENADDVFPGWDVVIDGSDNFPTRYLVNDACVRFGIPLVHGAVMQFEGQASVFWPAGNPGVNPCYRCLFPEPPAPEDAPDCATAGVLGVLPGVIGVLQATEALKLVLGAGKPLTGRLLRLDALDMSFRESRLSADPECTLCAPGKEFPGYPDYQAFCAG